MDCIQTMKIKGCPSNLRHNILISELKGTFELILIIPICYNAHIKPIF